MRLRAREYLCWFAILTGILGKILRDAQDDGRERMRIRNERTIKVKVKVNVNGKPDGGWRRVTGHNS